MKSMSTGELDLMLAKVNTCIGGQLRQIHTLEKQFGLGVWKHGTLVWIWIDFQSPAPGLYLLDRLPPVQKSQVKPWTLFLRAHFLNARFQGAERLAEFGRVVQLRWLGAQDRELSIEVRLFPQGKNVILMDGTKSLSWTKVKELSPVGESPVEGNAAIRPAEAIVQEWLASMFSVPKKEKSRSGQSSARGLELTPEQARQMWEKKRQKLQRAIEKMTSDADIEAPSRWRALGDWLVTHQSLDVPEEFQKLIDPHAGLPGNIEKAFQKAKDEERKQAGRRERLEQITAELGHLEALEDPYQWALKQLKSSQTQKPALLKAAGSRGRSLELPDGLKAIAGKSARDNLQILRKARAWDLWLHLRDYPSSHAIIQRNKQQKIKGDILKKVANWLVELTFPKKINTKVGETFSVIISECRYVRPIKGDSAGRVHYTNERTLFVTYDP